jgi:hypothetical protein
MHRDPAEEGLNLYQYADGNPANKVDPMGLCAETTQAPVPLEGAAGAAGATGATGSAWKIDPAAKYDPQTVAKLRVLIANEITKMIDKGEKSDCADVALAGLIRAASQIGLPVRLRYYANGWKYFDSSSGEYSSVEQFEKTVRENMGAINLWDNTKQIRDLNTVQTGDIMLYDLRDRGQAAYAGHTMPILDVAKGSNGKVATVTVAEGHTSRTPGEGTLVEKSSYTVEQILQKGGWGGPGRKEKQKDGTWRVVEPGAREGDWSRIGGGR